ncbi:MAG: hypothetical protein ABJP66_07905 [Hyphomicrobiales bacterium]|uniref:hypothetical protein n=1 Tax=Shimia thalassica TaxID=1715693 RepID=UPI0032971F74
MHFPSTLGALVLAVTATSAVAGPSSQHSAEASYHSGEASAHTSNAAVSGAATVSAVPVIAVGSVLAVTGSALQGLGDSTINAGSDLSQVSRPQQTINTNVMPNAAPTLD